MLRVTVFHHGFVKPAGSGIVETAFDTTQETWHEILSDLLNKPFIGIDDGKGVVIFIPWHSVISINVEEITSE